MAYQKTVFQSGGPPGISADELNKIGDGIEQAHVLAEQAGAVAGEVWDLQHDVHTRRLVFIRNAGVLSGVWEIEQDGSVVKYLTITRDTEGRISGYIVTAGGKTRKWEIIRDEEGNITEVRPA